MFGCLCSVPKWEWREEEEEREEGGEGYCKQVSEREFVTLLSLSASCVYSYRYTRTVESAHHPLIQLLLLTSHKILDKAISNVFRIKYENKEDVFLFFFFAIYGEAINSNVNYLLLLPPRSFPTIDYH